MLPDLAEVEKGVVMFELVPLRVCLKIPRVVELQLGQTLQKGVVRMSEQHWLALRRQQLRRWLDRATAD